MRSIVNHPKYGEIIYNENIWTGKKTLIVNGREATNLSRNSFIFNDTHARLKGSYIFGLKMVIGYDVIELVKQPEWYELLLALAPIMFLIVWGNVPALCAIFPVVGGAIGGAIGGVFTILSLALMRKTNSALYKVLIGLASFVAVLFIAYLIALALLSVI